MKFGIAILNPPYNQYGLHIRHIKKMKQFSDRMVFIIPSREGNIPFSKFNCQYRNKLKIYTFNSNEKFLLEKYTKFPQSQFYISLPKWSKGMKTYFETGEYKYLNKFNREEYYTFSFHTLDDLELFKKKLFSDRKFLQRGGTICPLYNEVLRGINYIKVYKEI